MNAQDKPAVVGASKRRSWTRIVVYTVLFLIVGTAVVVGWNNRPTAEASSCTAPRAADVNRAIRQQHQRAAASRKKARAQLGRAKRRAADAPSPAHARRVKHLTSVLRKAQAHAGAWHGAVASLDDQASTTFELGRDVNSGPHSVKFTTDKPVPGPRLLLVTAGPFTKVSGGRELGSRQVASWATLDRDRTHGTMYFCVRPQARLSTSSSGQYTGALTLEQGRVQRLDVPVTLDAPYPRWDLVFLVGLGVCVLCSAYTFFLRRPSLTAGTAGAPSDAEKDKTDDKAAAAAERATSVFRYPFGFLKDWLLFYTGILGVLTLVAGLVAASTAFVAQYISSETWDASTSTWITFVGALATAFIAGATAGKLAQIQFTTNLTPPESPADNSHGV